MYLYKNKVIVFLFLLVFVISQFSYSLSPKTINQNKFSIDTLAAYTNCDGPNSIVSQVAYFLSSIQSIYDISTETPGVSKNAATKKMLRQRFAKTSYIENIDVESIDVGDKFITFDTDIEDETYKVFVLLPGMKPIQGFDWIEFNELKIAVIIQDEVPDVQWQVAERPIDLEQEKEDGKVVSERLHTPLDADGDQNLSDEFMKNNLEDKGYCVADKAAIDGSHAIGDEGNQGYYVNSQTDENGKPICGKDFYLKQVEDYKKFFAKRKKYLNGRPIKLIIKPSIGGSHTSFEAIANMLSATDKGAEKPLIIGSYEMGIDYEAFLTQKVKELGIKWDQICILPCSKSGSTDETMLIFTDLMRIVLKNVTHNYLVRKEKGLSSKREAEATSFVNNFLQYLHVINFNTRTNEEIAPGDLFSGFNLNEFNEFNNERLQGYSNLNRNDIVNIFSTVFGNMIFETTDRPEASRLSAFVRNSGLAKILGDNAPMLAEAFDNVGGRWTGDQHIVTFLAYYNLDAKKYWERRYEGIKNVRDYKHPAVDLGNEILDTGVENIALVLPDELFWLGKSCEQNYNESLWQDGSSNLIAIKKSNWLKQSQNYSGSKDMILNFSDMYIPENNGVKTKNFEMLIGEGTSKDELVLKLADYFTLFYGTTHTIGTRLIARAIKADGKDVSKIDINDLDNEVTRIFQKNLFLNQPYVELGKGLLKKHLAALQKKNKETPGRDIIKEAYEKNLLLAREGSFKTNITHPELPENTSYWEEAIISPIKNDFGVTINYIKVAQDITEKRIAEQQTKDALKTKSDFISMVTHEIRTPMTAIKEGINMLFELPSSELSQQQQHLLNIVRKNVDRFGQLVNDVLDFQKLDAGRMNFVLKDVEINSIINDSIEGIRPLVSEKKLDLSIDLQSDLPHIQGDANRIIQVITNILHNAVKFTAQGTVSITSIIKDNNILISIKDSGIGIPEQDVPKIFHRFEQAKNIHAKYKGTGLGLAISLEIMKAHNGAIDVKSKEGKGTTFILTFPISKQKEGKNE